MSAGRHLAEVLDRPGARSAAGAVIEAADKADTGRHRAVRLAPATTEGPLVVAARMVEHEWLVADVPALHHAGLLPWQLHRLAAASVLDEPVTLACGATAAVIGRPGPLDVRGTVRCTGCCTALGYPAGAGAPLVDDACARVLEQRTAGLR